MMLTGQKYVTALRDLGLEFVEYPGWQSWGTRSKAFDPIASMIHWTASKPGTSATSYVRGRNLAGWSGERNGTLVLLTDWRSGHCGRGMSDVIRRLRDRKPITWETAPQAGDYYAYRDLYGIELDNQGFPEELWNPKLIRNGCAWAAAHALILGRGPESVISHRQYTSRKVDVPWRIRGTDGRVYDWREEVADAWDRMSSGGSFSPALPNPPKTGLFVHLTKDQELEILGLLRALVPHGAGLSAEYNQRRNLPATTRTAEVTQLVQYVYDALKVGSGGQQPDGTFNRRVSNRLGETDALIAGLADDIAAAGTAVGLEQGQVEQLAAAVVDGFLARLATAGSNNSTDDDGAATAGNDTETGT